MLEISCVSHINDFSFSPSISKNGNVVIVDLGRCTAWQKRVSAWLADEEVFCYRNVTKRKNGEVDERGLPVYEVVSATKWRKLENVLFLFDGKKVLPELRDLGGEELDL